MLDMNGSMSEMDVLTSAASGMRLQRTMLDLAARNVAAAQAATPDHPYSRLVARMQSVPEPSNDNDIDAAVDQIDARSNPEPSVDVRSEAGSGDALGEMIAVLDAQRAYEQNASVFDIGKRLAERTIDIGRS